MVSRGGQLAGVSRQDQPAGRAGPGSAHSRMIRISSRRNPSASLARKTELASGQNVRWISSSEKVMKANLNTFQESLLLTAPVTGSGPEVFLLCTLRSGSQAPVHHQAIVQSISVPRTARRCSASAGLFISCPHNGAGGAAAL